MAEAAAGVLRGVEHLIEGAVVAAKGIYDPSLPPKASLKPLTSVDVPLAYHSLSLIKGRAYLFGGKTADGDGALASNDLHLVILPSSGVQSMDYKKLDATSDSPPRRYGHCSATIEERIYIFGGIGEGNQPLEENGRVWVFDTASNKWSHFDPPGRSPRPGARSSCAAVASDHPRPSQRNLKEEAAMPQQPPDPEMTMPTIPDVDTYGTFIIQGGRGKDEQPLNDVWTFDISSRTWRELPDFPPPTSPNPSLAMVANRLYTFSAGQTSFVDVSRSTFDDQSGKGELGLAPLGPWQSLPPTSSSPDKPHPGERKGAAMVPVTTGQGRNYLLLLGGESQAGETLEDIWTLQLKPEGMTAASFKDAARMAIKNDTGEAVWSEVKYCDEEGVIVQEGQLGRGMGLRVGAAAARGGEVDGATVVVWGGIGVNGKASGDGMMITMEA